MVGHKKLKEFCELFVFYEKVEFEKDRVLLTVLDEGFFIWGLSYKKKII